MLDDDGILAPTYNISQTVTVCPYTDYSLTFYLYNGGNDGSDFEGSCDVLACFNGDCGAAITVNTDDADPEVLSWQQASRIYRGTGATSVTLSIGVSKCGILFLFDDVSMDSIGASSSSTSTSSVLSTTTTPTPTPTPSTSCTNLPKAPCFYITGHGDDRIEGQQLGVELPANDGTDEAYARFDITPSIWWIDENKYLHVAEPLDRVTMTEYSSNQEWWEVFTMDHVAADPDDFQPSLCSILPNGNLDCFQESQIQSDLVTLYGDFSPEDGVPAYNFPYWGGQAG
jgi:hypothetical protein